jgi:peroxiredoxin
MSRKAMVSFIFCSLFVAMFSVPSFASKVGDVAPAVENIKHKMMTGELVPASLLSVNQNGQYLVMEFFATTCSACTENLPLLAEIKNQFKNQVTFKLVAIDRDESTVLNYIQQVALAQEFTTVLDSKRLALKTYEVKHTPTTFVVSPVGKIVFKHIGVFEPETMQELRDILTK